MTDIIFKILTLVMNNKFTNYILPCMGFGLISVLKFYFSGETSLWRLLLVFFLSTIFTPILWLTFWFTFAYVVDFINKFRKNFSFGKSMITDNDFIMFMKVNKFEMLGSYFCKTINNRQVLINKTFSSVTINVNYSKNKQKPIDFFKYNFNGLTFNFDNVELKYSMKKNESLAIIINKINEIIRFLDEENL